MNVWQLPKTISAKLGLEPAPDVKAISAIAALSVGTLAISFAAIFIKWSEADISPNATVFNRFLIAAIGLGLWNGTRGIVARIKGGGLEQPTGQPPNSPSAAYTPKTMGLFLLLGGSYVLFQCTWAWSLAHTGIAISTLLHNLTPVFTSFGAWLILRQQFERRFFGGMVLAMGGATALGLADLHFEASELAGDAAALVSALFYGIYLLAIEQLRSQFRATTVLFWSSALGAGIMLPILLLTQAQLFPSSLEGWLAVLALAIICQIMGQGLVVYSLEHLSANFVAVFLLLDPAFTALEGWLIFAESLSPWSWLALGVALYGIYLTLLSQSDQTKSDLNSA